MKDIKGKSNISGKGINVVDKNLACAYKWWALTSRALFKYMTDEEKNELTAFSLRFIYRIGVCWEGLVETRDEWPADLDDIWDSLL